MPGKPEEILDECITLLRKEGSFETEKNPALKSPALLESLKIAKLAFNIPTKNPTLDQAAVWNRISSRLNPEAQIQSPAESFIPSFEAFRLPVPRAVFAGILVVMAFWLISSTATAAQNSLPGQTLYAVKRTVEKIQLTLTVDEVKKTEIRIKHAENRLTEAKTIVDTSSTTDEKIVEQTLNDLKDTTAKVSNESSDNSGLLKKVVELTDKQESVLSDIENKVSGETKKVAGEALDTALETKSAAVKNLVKLENPDTQTESGTATTTEGGLNGDKDPSSPTKNGGNLNEEQATTTDSAVKKLGSPSESSTVIITPDIQNFDKETTTPQILELK